MADLAGLLADLVSGDDPRAEAAAGQLSELGPLALSALLELLDSPEDDHRWWAVRALASLEGSAVAGILVRALYDPQPAVRQCAALGLRRHPSSEAVGPLIDALGDVDRLTARLAADALAAIGRSATPHLVEALESADPAVRIEAARALAIAQDPQAVPALYRGLDDPSAMVQYWAEEALERMGVGMVFFKP